MSFKLELFNPSNYPRGGVVAVPWLPIAQTTGISPDRLLLFDEQNRSLPLQIDQPDMSDRSHDKLCFLLQDLIPPGPEDYSVPSAVLRAEEGVRSRQDGGGRIAVLGEPQRRVELCNQRLTVSLSLLAERELEKGKWYAGAADSVRLDGIEILDEFAARFHSGPSEEQWKNHDPEKRCMQIDKLHFWNAPWEEKPLHEVKIYEKSYRLASQCLGPVRATVMIVCPFYYSYNDSSTGHPVQMECALHRILSMNVGADSDYVLEEIYVKGGLAQMRGGHSNLSSTLSFAAHYFTNMDVGYSPVVYRYEHIPDWLAVGCPEGNKFDPHPGYGFATDVHTASFSAPVPNYPNKERAHRTFCWGLPPDKAVHCLHAFIRGEPAGFGARTGRLWYEQIYKPLNNARVAGMARPNAA